MYAKLFASIYQGTLRGNTHGLVVFTNMLAHADSAGWVDIHPRAISEEVGLTIDEVNFAIKNLESPDPESRSPEEDGRRIVRLDEHRAWGWRIVNHGKYRSIRDEADRREQNRIAQEKFRNKNKPKKEEVSNSNQSKPRKPISAQAQAEAEAEAEAEALKPLVPSDAGRPSCQHEKIIELYHETLPMMPVVRVWTEARKKKLSSRWREDEKRQDLDFWKRFFTYVSKSDFLCGRTEKPFNCDLEWLVNASNFVKVIEGKYHA